MAKQGKFLCCSIELRFKVNNPGPDSGITHMHMRYTIYT